MNILIAGGAGFIGHNLSLALELLGHSIYIVDSLTDYGAIPKLEILTLATERMRVMSENKLRAPHNEDIKNTNEIAKVIKRYDPDVIVNLAAFSRVTLVHNDPVMASDSLIKGLFNLLYSPSNIKRFVQVSSSMVYGNWPTSNYEHYISEDVQCNPIGYYGILKYAGEGIVKQYCQDHDVEYTIVRPSAVYGPRDLRDRVVPKFLSKAAKNETITVNGESSVDFTYIDDFIKGMAQCVVNDNAANETFNITREKSRTLMEAAEIAIEITGSQSQIQMAEQSTLFGKRGTCSNTKARNLLGYDPTIDIEDGFINTWDWLKNKI